MITYRPTSYNGRSKIINSLNLEKPPTHVVHCRIHERVKEDVSSTFKCRINFKSRDRSHDYGM